MLVVALPAAASAPASVDGRWTNPKRSVIIDVGRCGEAWCGTVVWATPKAKAIAKPAAAH